MSFPWGVRTDFSLNGSLKVGWSNTCVPGPPEPSSPNPFPRSVGRLVAEGTILGPCSEGSERDNSQQVQVSDGQVRDEDRPHVIRDRGRNSSLSVHTTGDGMVGPRSCQDRSFTSTTPYGMTSVQYYRSLHRQEPTQYHRPPIRASVSPDPRVSQSQTFVLLFYSPSPRRVVRGVREVRVT